MKKLRLMTGLIIFFIITSICITSFGTTKINQITNDEVLKKIEEMTEEEKISFFNSYSNGVSFKDSVKRSVYNKLTTEENDSLPSKYDLRKVLNNRIKVKDQEKSKTCWAFAYTSALETSLAVQRNKFDLEFSPLHFEYVSCDLYDREIESGGNSDYSVAIVSGGYGPVNESDFSFSDYYNSSTYSLKQRDEVNGLYDLNIKARIYDTFKIPQILKKIDNGTTRYFDDSDDEYSSEEVNGIRKKIKSCIQNNGGLEASVHIAVNLDGTCNPDYYNDGTSAYYYDGEEEYPNHSVVIIGWDDNFSKNNFNSGHRPKNNGAYIVLNSSGEDFGENGYMYISYEDRFIEYMINGIENVDEFNDESYYDNLYQYDENGMNSVFIDDLDGTAKTSLYGANIYSKKSSKTEYVKEIGIYIDETCGVQIFANLENDDLTNLEIIAEPEEALESGFHVIKLATPLKISGDKFAIGVKYTNQEGTCLPLELNIYETLKNSDEYRKYAEYNRLTSKVNANLGESFYSRDGNNWVDLNNNFDAGDFVFKKVNNCIKVYTIESDEVLVTGVSLNLKNIEIEEGGTETLIATVEPENATNKNVMWISSNTSIAEVSDSGVVTGKKEGTTTITVKTQDGEKIATCIVKVLAKKITEITEEDVILNKEDIKITGVSLNSKNIEIEEGGTETLIATVEPENATNKNVMWISSDESVAEVSDKGVVIGKKEGTTTITVKTQDGEKIATCTVKVLAKKITEITEEDVILNKEDIKITGVSLNSKNIEIEEGGTETLIATVEPENATNKNVMWISSNTSIAEVSDKGVVTGKKEGTTTITVKTQDGEKIATCTVKVLAKKITEITVEDVILNKEDIKIKEGKTESLIATIKPENATNKNISWTSSDESVAKVVGGVITGIKKGTAKIVVTTENGNKKDECNVIVEENENIIKVEKISFNKEELKLEIGDSTNLVVIFNPTNATNKNVTWISSNEKVATIDKNGIITAKSKGTTTINAISEDGGKVANCKLDVTEDLYDDDDIYKDSKQTNKIEDHTTSNQELPDTGKRVKTIICILLIIVVCYLLIRIRKMKDVK